MQQRLVWTTVVVCLIGIGTAGVLTQAPSPPTVRLPGPEEPLTLSAGRTQFRVALVAGGLVAPWSLAFLPDGETMLVTESPGRLRMIRGGVLEPEPVWVTTAARGNDVLHGLAIHPDFEQNGLVYLSYAKEGEENRRTLAVSRGRLEGTRLVEVREIFVADAWENAANAIAGRMIFGPDRTLYVTVGDRDRLCCTATDDNSLRMRAQDLTSHVGKTLRLTDEGGVPPDNPFVGRADARPEIFTYGHRNGYGLAFHPETGELWHLDIGPMGGDRVDILRPGSNYGWPLISMGRNYTGTLVSEQPWWREGMENPRLFWVPAITPSSIAFYTGDRFPQWQGSLFVTALATQQVQRIAFNQPSQAERREPMLTELRVRFRDVQQGPDGNLYLTTELRYGSTNPDGTVLRIEPAD
jgi:aldose sugar dehydrogenase